MHKIAAFLIVFILLPATQAQVPAESYDWPEHDTVSAALETAAEQAPRWVTLHTIGTSVVGKPLQLAHITDPDSAVPMEDRAVTLILTQQHGNEPAGTPAAVDLLERIVDGGTIASTLTDQVLLLWPLANPDGGTAFTRANDAGTDLNRDHIHLIEPETKALHAAMNRWDIHVGMDHHEYSGTGIGSPSPVRFYDYDATILHPRHGNVRAPTMEWAASLMYDGVFPALQSEGYTAGEYGVQTAAGVPVSHIAGGPDPGILRNNFGLNNIAGLLVESYVGTIGNPVVDAEHRIDVHRTVMDATLEYVHANADAFVAAKRASERLNVEEPMDEYIEEWPDDPVTGEPSSSNRRGPLAPAYQTPEELDPLMTDHGLPAGMPHESGAIYSLQHERAGLLAAILAADSSRRVPESATALDSAPEPAQETPAQENHDTAAPTMLLVGAVLAIAVLISRRRT